MTRKRRLRFNEEIESSNFGHITPGRVDLYAYIAKQHVKEEEKVKKITRG